MAKPKKKFMAKKKTNITAVNVKRDKIRICYTSEHCCIRVIKISKALLDTGLYEIHGVAKQISWGSDCFDKFSFYHNKKQFMNIIRSIDADVYMHANEPNHQLNWIREVKPDAKIILDGHDFDSLRIGVMPVDEHKAISNCDGILFVSKGVQDYILDLHKKQLNGKPHAYVEHYCNKEFLTPEFNPKAMRRGLVYQGGIQSPPYKNDGYRYRQLYKTFRQISDQGNELHLIAGNPDAQITYSNTGIFTYPPHAYPELMKKLTNFKWGMIVWNNEDLSQIHVNLTRTNKEQEYLACGLPIIVFGAPDTAEYVKKHKIGLVFNKVSEILPDVLDEAYPELKKNVDALRPKINMEKKIFKVRNLIDEILKQ